MPAISIITPAGNALPPIERAYQSLARQTFADWEWLPVDDGSTDGTAAVLRRWAAEDARVRPLAHSEYRGAAAARNTALRAAHGEFIAYLDHDGEFYRRYLARVARMRDKGDVLVFAYDIIHEGHCGASGAPPRSLGLPQGKRPRGCAACTTMTTWEPGRVRDDMFTTCIAKPLGVAHRRDLAVHVGGFNELLWGNEEWDLWKRLARAGARFVFVQAKSGLFHVPEGSLGQVGRPNEGQRTTLEANWRAGRPIFAD